MKGCLLFALVAGTLLRSSACPCLAAEGDKAAARAHYETATRLFDIAEYAEALKEYKAAYLAKPDPAFLFNIGQCLRKLDRNTEALGFFQQYLKKTPPDEPNRALAEARIRNIEAGLNSDQDPFAKPEAAKPAPLPPTMPEAAPASPHVPVPEPATVPEMPPPATAPPVSTAPLLETRPVASVPAAQPAGADVASRASATEAPPSTSVFRTWWFWTGVGAVVVAGAVTAFVLSTRGGGTEIPGSSLGSRPVFP